MRIGEVAAITGISVSSVRFYEKKGLLTPARESENQYREYSQEDILRIKEILIFRKIGMSIETIYLIFQKQINLEQTLMRQKIHITEQIELLNGSLRLCDMMLETKQENLREADIDYYLAYVHEEEQTGGHFMQVSELVEDITDFTVDSVLPYYPFAGLNIQYPLGAKVLSFLFWGLLLATPAIYIMENLFEDRTISFCFLGVYFIIFAIYGYSFWKFRKNRRISKEKSREER